MSANLRRLRSHIRSLIYAAILIFFFSLQTEAFEPFVDPLPIPPVLRIEKGQPAELTLRMTQFKTKIHRDLPEVFVWGFNGSSPGPTIEVDSGTQLRVHWLQDLPTTHIFKLPEGFSPMKGAPDVRAVVHLHGAAVSQPSITNRLHNNDGWPDLWLTRGQTQISEYPNLQRARTLWYHDHAMGTTGRNVAAGLAGMYLIHDEEEKSAKLPSGKYDVPLLIQSRGFNEDGSLYYVPKIQNEFYGNSVFVNGKLMPYLEVDPKLYRFRLINGSNARTFSLKLVNNDDMDQAGPPLLQIGSDGGFLETPVTFDPPADFDVPGLILAPAERADILVDFSNSAGKNLLLMNNAFPDDPDAQMPLPLVMLFKVKTPVEAPEPISLPTGFSPILRMNPEQASRTRQIVFDQMNMPAHGSMLTLNGKMWHDPVTEFPLLGSTEVWELVNTLVDAHPFHIHMVDFQVLDRQSYNVSEFLKSGKILPTAPAVQPSANEMGWKDTVRVLPGTVTRVIMKFTPYLGHFVYHCHILEHEDMDMMRPFEVQAPPTP